MKTGQIIGLTLLIGGFVLMIAYSMIESIQEIDIATIPLIILFGGIAIVIGIIVLLISIIFEQTSDMKKRKKEINKEDFEP